MCKDSYLPPNSKIKHFSQSQRRPRRGEEERGRKGAYSAKQATGAGREDQALSCHSTVTASSSSSSYPPQPPLSQNQFAVSCFFSLCGGAETARQGKARCARAHHLNRTRPPPGKQTNTTREETVHFFTTVAFIFSRRTTKFSSFLLFFFFCSKLLLFTSCDFHLPCPLLIPLFSIPGQLLSSSHALSTNTRPHPLP